jgi:serine/tyrosine/threonine adenylyltransferase
MAKFPISLLPIPSQSLLLTANLTPDVQVPTISAFLKLLSSKPSVQRRARLLDPESHFSYVSPLPLPFPYRIPFSQDGVGVIDKQGWVEKWLTDREAIRQTTTVPPKRTLNLYYPDNREQRRELIGLAKTGLDDCLPLLDVGDAFETLGVPSLVPLSNENGDRPLQNNEDAVSARVELVDVLSGHALLASSESGFAPWALRYSGHQFGSFAGQLGDGRAISVRKYLHLPSVFS